MTSQEKYQKLVQEAQDRNVRRPSGMKARGACEVDVRDVMAEQGRETYAGVAVCGVRHLSNHLESKENSSRRRTLGPANGWTSRFENWAAFVDTCERFPLRSRPGRVYSVSHVELSRMIYGLHTM